MTEETEKYRAALTLICRRRGAFSRDPLQHADNVIREGVNIAREALGLPRIADLEHAEDGLPEESPADTEGSQE